MRIEVKGRNMSISEDVREHAAVADDADVVANAVAAHDAGAADVAREQARAVER